MAAPGQRTQREKASRCSRLGGLFVLGTERHEARRIDNQLRGRAGRQGDPGESRFFVALEDDLMLRFGGERVKSLMDTPGRRGRRADRERHGLEADRVAPR